MIGAMLPYFGGKRSLAGRIVREIGVHKVYWEPFCGSLAVLFSKPAVLMETVNDLHGDVVNLARVIQNRDTAERLYATLYPMVPCQQLHAEARQRVNAADPILEVGPDVERAADFFFVSWMARNGLTGISQSAGGNGFAVRFTSNGGSPGPRWVKAVEGIPGWHERLRSVLVLSHDGIGVCERVEDKPGTVIYADPPYLKEGAQYRHNFDIEDHRRLADALNRFEKTRVVVSYYDHPDLEVLYPGWRKIDVSLTKAMARDKLSSAGDPEKAPEVLLVRN